MQTFEGISKVVTFKIVVHDILRILVVLSSKQSLYRGGWKNLILRWRIHKIE
jgi:hypothetical protein